MGLADVGCWSVNRQDHLSYINTHTTNNATHGSTPLLQGIPHTPHNIHTHPPLHTHPTHPPLVGSEAHSYTRTPTPTPNPYTTILFSIKSHHPYTTYLFPIKYSAQAIKSSKVAFFFNIFPSSYHLRPNSPPPRMWAIAYTHPRSTRERRLLLK